MQVFATIQEAKNRGVYGTEVVVGAKIYKIPNYPYMLALEEELLTRHCKDKSYFEKLNELRKLRIECLTWEGLK